MRSGDFYHKPVLFEEAIEELRINPSEIYVDATFGGGGHSRGILDKLDTGRLIAFDQDEDAWKNAPEDSRFELVPENFRYLKKFLKVKNALTVAGILADLGVSSYQFDTAERGFSIRMDAPLDMRMDRRQEFKAVNILHEYSEEQLWKIFESYGEVRNAKSLAAHLVKMRKQFPMQTVGELKTALIPLLMGKERRYLAQVFQALRIEVNAEMEVLEEFLRQAVEVLRPGGRLVVITFHSVEDRLVKRFFKSGEVGKEKIEKKWIEVHKKPVLPGKKEKKENSRAASAKMRVVEKTE